MSTVLSQGSVHINVGRDLNISAGQCCADIPEDCVLPKDSSWKSARSLFKLIGVLFALMIGLAVVLAVSALAANVVTWVSSVAAALAARLVAWISSVVTVCMWIGQLVIGGWMVGRAAELYLLIERALGGGPWRLILLSRLLGRREIEVQLCPQPELPPLSTPATCQLTAGSKSHGLASLGAREALYVD